jgi:2-polyprenyl-3-methyl-5-hydroxy-6-metoxy-1,4-benzoquinol methylase
MRQMSRAQTGNGWKGGGQESDAHASGNRRTIVSYEGCASDYARSTEPKPGSDNPQTLTRFLEVLPAGACVLEVGSGPGWDADWLENQGARVRRTDATAAFIDIQKARGATAELLDVVTDDLGGPYAGVIAHYVLQHVDRSRLPDVLAKISKAIVDGGAFLLTLREGRSDLIEHGSSGGVYYVVEWTKPDLDEILCGLSFRECWSTSSEDADGKWLTILTGKEGG